MHFKLIIAFTQQDKTEEILTQTRRQGAKGATVISQARGEGVAQKKTFFGLGIEQQTDMILLLVEEHLARDVLETINRVAQFDNENEGIAFQIDVEDAVGISHQIKALNKTVEEKI